MSDGIAQLRQAYAVLRQASPVLTHKLIDTLETSHVQDKIAADCHRDEFDKYLAEVQAFLRETDA